MILASNNAHKLEEFRAIFADMGIEIIPQSAAGCHFEVDETGETFEENAYLKAIAVTRATGQPAVADDSGLMVDALGGALYQGGEEADAAFFVYFADTVRLQQLVNASAFFVCQVVSGDVLYVEADGLL